MTTLAPLPVQSFRDSNGNPLAGGSLYTYSAGTSTPLATYTDSTGGTPNANPIVLNSRGEANVWLATGYSYKFALYDSLAVLIWTVDNITNGAAGGAPVPLASTAITDIGSQTSQAVEISGTTAITSFGTNYNGPRFLRFTGALVLTQSASLNLPSGANITTAAGDTAIAYPNLALNGWNVVGYTKASALAAAAGANSDITALNALAAGGLPANNILTANVAAAVITAPKLSGAQTGTAPVYGVRAWCYFNGNTTGTNAPTAGGNVTSVTRNSVGDCTINFTTAMPSANYAVMGLCNFDTLGSNSRTISAPYTTVPTASAIRICTQLSSTNTLNDCAFVYIAILA